MSQNQNIQISVCYDKVFVIGNVQTKNFIFMKNVLLELKDNQIHKQLK